MRRPPRCLVGSLEEDVVALHDEARHHLRRVLRLRAGAPLELVDGRGGLARASLREDGRARIEAREPVAPPPAAPVHLVCAIPRRPRLDWLVEKATELGVASLRLARTEHGEHAVPPARLQRLRRKADEALAQSRRLHRMALEPARPWPACVRAPGADELWLGSAPGDPALPAGRAVRAPGPRAGRVLGLLVGPEGGLTSDEVDAALAAGARPVRLGAHVLRVETAAIALAAVALLGPRSSDR